MAVRPVLILRPRSGWQALDLAEVWRFRDLMSQLGMRDIKLRYRQTALGVGWVLIQPLLTAGIFAFVFGRVAGLSTGNIPSFWFAFTGVTAWTLFQQILSRASLSLIQNAPIISKVYFPRLVLPLSSVVSCLLDFAVALVLLCAGLLLLGLNPGVRVLALPLWLLLLVLLASGIGMYAAALTARYRDIQYALPFLIQFLMYASPVGYAVRSVPAELRFGFALNPLAGLMEGVRWSLLGTALPPLWMIGYSTGISIGIFLLGMYGFRRIERTLADVL